MDPVTMAAIMAAAGLAKSELVDRPREQAQRKEAAITALYSPWTGMTPNQVQTADAFGSALQGGMTGLQLGQSMQNAEQMKNLQTQQLALMRSQQGMYDRMAAGMGGAPAPTPTPMVARNPAMVGPTNVVGPVPQNAMTPSYADYQAQQMMNQMYGPNTGYQSPYVTMR